MKKIGNIYVKNLCLIILVIFDVDLVKNRFFSIKIFPLEYK